MVQTSGAGKQSIPVMWPDKIPVANTYIGEEEARAAYDVVKSGWLSMGKKVAQFETDFARAVGAKHAIAINNGTAALHAVLAALEIGPGDEVIVPSLTFVSSGNVVLYQNAKLVLAECDPLTYNITAEEIKKRITPKTKAIMPVDMNGMPVDYDAILKVADHYGIPVIADSAESLGAYYKNRPVGSIAPVHCFSFFPNKNITTGEGGMITVQEAKLADKIRKLRHQGQEARYEHVLLGYNYRMTEVQAAIGIEQLKKFRGVIQEKNKLAEKYNQAFAACKEIKAPQVPEYVTQHAWYMYAVSVDAAKRDEIVKQLAENNIETRLSFPPVHNQPYYRAQLGYKENDLPATMSAWRSLINIPIWKNLGEERQDYVIETLKRIAKEV